MSLRPTPRNLSPVFPKSPRASTPLVPELVSDTTSDTSTTTSLSFTESATAFLLQSPHRAMRLHPSQIITLPRRISRKMRTSFSPRLMVRDRIDHKKHQAILLARAIRQRTYAEETEALKRAEEEALFEDCADHIHQHIPAKQALTLARATRETIAATHQTAVRQVQVTERMLSCLQDHLEDTSRWLQEADLQVGEVLEVLASNNFEGLDPEDFRPKSMLLVPPSSPLHDSSLSSESNPWDDNNFALAAPHESPNSDDNCSEYTKDWGESCGEDGECLISDY